MRISRTAVVSSLLITVSLAGYCAQPASAVPLDPLLDEAAQNNPDILGARRAWQAAAQVPSQVSTLPDPQVMLQHFSVGSPRPLAGFSNSNFAYVGIGVSQDVPFPGKLGLRSEVAERDAAASRERFESVRRAVLAEVKDAYFQLAYAQQTLGILERDGQLLEQVRAIADARYRVGQGSQQDVLKAQLEQTKLLKQIALQRQLLNTQQARLRMLLNRPQDSVDITAEQAVETPLSYGVDELLARVRTDNPDVTGQQEMVKRQSLQVELARKDRLPDFGVQYMWQHTGQPFRDYYMLTFSVRLPIYRSKKLNPEMAQAVEELNRSRREYESRIQSAYFEVRDQYLAAETASQVLKIYREGLIPQALATFRAGLAAYESGTQDFQTLLASFLDVLNLDEEYWKTLTEHETALARLEQLSGVPLR